MADGSDVVHSHAVFHSVIEVMLNDGELTREEQRLAIKLGILLFKDEDELKNQPKRIYDAVMAGEEIDGGRPIIGKERIKIYRELFETACVNSSLSHDEIAVIAELRTILSITDDENAAVVEQIRIAIEESVQPTRLDEVRDTLDTIVDFVGRPFDAILSKRG